MLKHVLNKYLNSSFFNRSYPKGGHNDSNAADVNSNLELKKINKRKCPNININGYVKI